MRTPRGSLLLPIITGHQRDRVELEDDYGKKTVKISEQVGENMYWILIPLGPYIE